MSSTLSHKKNFHRINGAPPETLAHVKYEAPREVCAANALIALFRNEALNKFVMSIEEGLKQTVA